jgi:hypothetical protein
VSSEEKNLKKVNLFNSFFTVYYLRFTVHLKYILALIICTFTVSCVITAEKKYIDIFDGVNLSEKQIFDEIKLREDKIEELKLKIQMLKNYIAKFKTQIDIDSSYSQDTGYLVRAHDKIKEIIDKNKIQIEKLNSEIRALKRKKDLI